MSQRKKLRDIICLVEGAGLRVVEVNINKHCKLTVELGGKRRNFTASLNNSDWFAIKKIQADARRLASEMGASVNSSNPV